MPNETTDDYEPSSDPDAALDIALELKAPAVRALLAMKGLDASVAAKLQAALERQAPSAAVMSEQVRRTIGRIYRAPGSAA